MQTIHRLALTLLLCSATALAAQTPAQTPAPNPTQTHAPTPAPMLPLKPLTGAMASHPDWPHATPADVESVDALIRALYDVISGPPGPRDWARFRSLFAPDAKLGIVRLDRAAGANGQPARPGDIYFITPDTYVERDAPIFAQMGFFEHGIANRTEQFGNLVSVWSTYESRHAPTDATPFARGINSIQLVRVHGRWWIASLVWEDEREGVTLPEKYLHP